MASTKPGKTSRLLLYRHDAGGMSDQVLAKLTRSLPNFTATELRHGKDFRDLLTTSATVVVAGGDGTVGYVCRTLAGSRHRLGILSLGTFNNFARALKIPQNLDRALAVIHKGNVRSITLGRVNDQYFLEAAAIGIFGEAIAIGEKAKESEYGGLAADLRAFAGARPFSYTIRGDLEGEGRALSLVFTNTPTTGNRMAVGTSDPTRPYLDLSVQVGASRTDLISRALASAVLDRHVDKGGMSFHFRAITIETKPGVRVYGDNMRLGRTPVTISAHPGALRIFVP